MLVNVASCWSWHGHNIATVEVCSIISYYPVSMRLLSPNIIWLYGLQPVQWTFFTPNWHKIPRIAPVSWHKQILHTLSLALGAVLLLAYNSPYLHKIAAKIFCNFQIEILSVDAIKYVASLYVYLRSTIQPHRYFANPYFQDEYFIEVSESYIGAGGTCDCTLQRL